MVGKSAEEAGRQKKRRMLRLGVANARSNANLEEHGWNRQLNRKALPLPRSASATAWGVIPGTICDAGTDDNNAWSQS